MMALTTMLRPLHCLEQNIVDNTEAKILDTSIHGLSALHAFLGPSASTKRARSASIQPSRMWRRAEGQSGLQSGLSPIAVLHGATRIEWITAAEPPGNKRRRAGVEPAALHALAGASAALLALAQAPSAAAVTVSKQGAAGGLSLSIRQPLVGGGHGGDTGDGGAATEPIEIKQEVVQSEAWFAHDSSGAVVLPDFDTALGHESNEIDFEVEPGTRGTPFSAVVKAVKQAEESPEIKRGVVHKEESPEIKRAVVHKEESPELCPYCMGTHNSAARARMRSCQPLLSR